MPARRASPLLIWSLVVLVSVVLLGGSFAYAKQVGDPTVREDAQRRRPTAPRDVTTTVPGSLNGGIGGGGVSSGPYQPAPIDPRTGAPTGAGSGALSFLASDFARVLPPATCVNVLEEIARQGTLTLVEVAEAWDFVMTCAASQGQSGIPPLDVITSDPLGQQCVAVVLARTTLYYRSPNVVTPPMDRLVTQCQAQGAIPALPGLGGGLTPPPTPPAGTATSSTAPAAP